MATKKRELFDAAEYVKRMDLMIAKLRTKTPGEAVGKVGKNEILTMRREALQELVKDGYSVNQIAEAMKEDVFSILPKTITEMVKATGKATGKAAGTAAGKAAGTAAGKAAGKAAGTAAGKAAVGTTKTEQNKQPSAVAGAPAAGSKATFEVKPDTRDL